MMKENAELFNEVVKSDVIVTDGWMYEMQCISWGYERKKILHFGRIKHLKLWIHRRKILEKTKWSEKLQ